MMATMTAITTSDWYVVCLLLKSEILFSGGGPAEVNKWCLTHRVGGLPSSTPWVTRAAAGPQRSPCAGLHRVVPYSALSCPLGPHFPSPICPSAASHLPRCSKLFAQSHRGTTERAETTGCFSALVTGLETSASLFNVMFKIGIKFDLKTRGINV